MPKISTCKYLRVIWRLVLVAGIKNLRGIGWENFLMKWNFIFNGIFLKKVAFWKDPITDSKRPSCFWRFSWLVNWNFIRNIAKNFTFYLNEDLKFIRVLRVIEINDKKVNEQFTDRINDKWFPHQPKSSHSKSNYSIS